MSVFPEWVRRTDMFQSCRLRMREAHLRRAAQSLSRPAIDPSRPAGLNIIGPVTAQSGIGQGVRGLIAAADSAGIPSALHDVAVGPVRSRDETFAARLTSRLPYAVTILAVQPEWVVPCARSLPGGWDGVRRIAYWAWELSEAPQSWGHVAKAFDAVWTPSQFSANAIRNVTPIPVHVVPHAIRPMSDDRLLSRSALQLPEGRFIVVSLCDMHSTFERKHPLGAVRAFRKAFLHDQHATLILHCTHPEADPEGFDLLRAEIGDDPSIILSTDPWPVTTVHSLLAACDVYLSLHRAEGFGLPLAEAMSYGTPVVATGYGGCTDFLSDETGFPVAYHESRLTRTTGPYARGQVWAEPDIDAAAERLRLIRDHHAEARVIAGRGRGVMREQWSPEAIGQKIIEKLK